MLEAVYAGQDSTVVIVGLRVGDLIGTVEGREVGLTVGDSVEM